MRGFISTRSNPCITSSLVYLRKRTIRMLYPSLMRFCDWILTTELHLSDEQESFHSQSMPASKTSSKRSETFRRSTRKSSAFWMRSHVCESKSKSIVNESGPLMARCSSVQTRNILVSAWQILMLRQQMIRQLLHQNLKSQSLVQCPNQYQSTSKKCTQSQLREL